MYLSTIFLQMNLQAQAEAGLGAVVHGGKKAVGPKIPELNVSQMPFPWGLCHEVQAEPCPVPLQALASLCRQ